MFSGFERVPIASSSIDGEIVVKLSKLSKDGDSLFLLCMRSFSSFDLIEG